MNKNDIAQQINCTDNLTRIIMLDEKNFFEIGQIYDNKGKAESWAGKYSSMSFLSEVNEGYKYVLQCENVPCHVVDYDNEDECDVLGCEGCESEGEVLVTASTKMKVIDIGDDGDYEELGYYPITMQII